MTEEAPPWLKHLLKAYPETALVVHALVLKGLRTGSCTAEDAHHIPVPIPNCRGAAMKYLKKFGFVKVWEAPLHGTTKKSRGHTLFRWRLDRPQLAEGLIGYMFNGLERGIEPDGQTLLPYGEKGEVR